MSQLLKANKATEKLVNKLIPDEELAPSSVEEVLKLPSFFSKLKGIESSFDRPFGELKQDVQDALVFRRLQQLVNIALVNPLWKELLNNAGVDKAPINAEEWQRLPIVDKTMMQPLFTGTRPGMVVPLSHGGFEVVASGGTSSGKPSEIV